VNPDYRQLIYDNYISNTFGNLHSTESGVAKEMEMFAKYFHKNYGQFMPNDKSARILDAGCGIGHFLHYANSQGYSNITGVDVSTENINYCRNKGFKVIQEDLFQFLEQNPNSFDLIVFNDVIEHFKKDEIITILEAMHHTLTSNGRLIIKTCNMANPITGSGSMYFDFTHETGFTEISLKEVLTATKFNNIILKGTDIYIFNRNPLNYVAKFVAAIYNQFFYLSAYLYGRKSIKIFTKDIMAIADKT